MKTKNETTRGNTHSGTARIHLWNADGTYIRSVNSDTTAPVFSGVPADLIVPASSLDGAIVNYSPATANDSCGPAVVSYSLASGSLFPVGTTTLIVTATDAVGNQATASFTVTVTHGVENPTRIRIAYCRRGNEV